MGEWWTSNNCNIFNPTLVNVVKIGLAKSEKLEDTLMDDL